MKRFLRNLACLLLVVAVGLSLAACGETMGVVKLATGDVTLSEQTFTNNESLKISKDDKTENQFVVTGEANKLSKTQAALWAAKYEDKAYVVFDVELNAGAKAEYTGVLGDNKTYVNEAQNKDYLTLVRAVENNEQTFSVKVTEKDAKESVTYTIVFDLDNYKE